jgi:protein-S-isoprenylcysteine O-methyltransferase Ste14
MNAAELHKAPRVPALAGTALAAGVIVGQLLVDTHTPRGVAGIALVLLVAGVPLIRLPFRDLPRHGEPLPGAPYYVTTRLVDRGVYRLVRHPQYLGYILLVVGFGLLHPHLAILGLAGGAAVLFCVQAVQEERACRAQWPAAYEAYAKRVPRFNLLVGVIRTCRGLPGSM